MLRQWVVAWMIENPFLTKTIGFMFEETSNNCADEHNMLVVQGYDFSCSTSGGVPDHHETSLSRYLVCRRGTLNEFTLRFYLTYL